MRLPHLITVVDFANPIYRGFSESDPYGDRAFRLPRQRDNENNDDYFSRLTSRLPSNIVDWVALKMRCLVEFDSATDISDPFTTVPVAGSLRSSFRVYSAVRQRAYFNCITSVKEYRNIRKLFAIFRKQRLFYGDLSELLTRPALNANSDTAFNDEDVLKIISAVPPSLNIDAYGALPDGSPQSPEAVGTPLDGQTKLARLNPNIKDEPNVGDNPNGRQDLDVDQRWTNSERSSATNVVTRTWSELIPDGFTLGVFQDYGRWNDPVPPFNPFKRDVVGAAREIARYKSGQARGLEFVNVAAQGGVMKITLELAYDRF